MGKIKMMKSSILRHRLGCNFVIAAFTTILFGCNDKLAEQIEIIRPAKIITVGDASKELMREFPGEVEASDKAVQSFRVSGELKELPAQAGLVVKKGDILAKLDPKDYKLVYDDAKAKYDLAKAQFKRAEKIWAKRLIARADYDKAKSQYLAEKANLEKTKANLNYTILRSPFDGVVSKVHVDNFTNVRANDPIVNIQSRDNIDIVFQVPESIVARVKKGQGKKAIIHVSFPSKPEQPFPATLKEFDSEADPQTQTFRVVVTIARPKNVNVLEGMSTTVKVDFSKVVTEVNNSIILPGTAIFAAEDEPVDSRQRYVWKVDPTTMTANKQAITVGQITANGIEVTSGIEPGTQVIAAGVNFVREGQKVKPWQRERGL